MNDRPKLRIAVLASGQGSNLQAIIDHCRTADIQGDVIVVVSNKRHAYALTRAKEAGIETLLFESEKFKTKTMMCAKIAKALKERNVDLICLAGYMSKIEPCLIRSFPQHIINIHPALLPKYGGKGMYGHFVHEAVIAAKEKESGCTIHIVDEIYDHGAILAQSKVNISADETPTSLAEKIHPVEHQLYVQVLRDICSGKINLNKEIH